MEVILVAVAFCVFVFVLVAAGFAGFGRPEKVGVAITATGLLLGVVSAHFAGRTDLWTVEPQEMDAVFARTRLWIGFGHAGLGLAVTGALWLVIACTRRIWLTREELFPFAYRGRERGHR